MKDIDIIKAFRVPLEAHLAVAFGRPVPVISLNQPTQQGREEDGRGVYFQFLFDQIHGWPQIKHKFEKAKNEFKTTETQAYLGKIQISTLWPQDPASDFLTSAKDIATECCRYMNTRQFIQLLRRENIGVMRVTSVRPAPISNDRDQFEYMPNFDIDFAFLSDINYATPRIEAVEYEVHRV